MVFRNGLCNGQPDAEALAELLREETGKPVGLLSAASGKWRYALRGMVVAGLEPARVLEELNAMLLEAGE